MTLYKIFKENEEKLDEKQLAVLKCLDNDTDTWGEHCIAFDWIEGETKLSKKEVSKACKVLRENKLVHFYRGLMTEDGEVAGSGYCISVKGRTFLHPCDKCGCLAEYDWYENEKGEHVYTDKDTKHIQLCHDHYTDLKDKLLAERKLIEENK